MDEKINKQEKDFSSNFLTRTTIREANHHLQMLHQHNQELEQIVGKQKEELKHKDLIYVELFKAKQLLENHCQQLKILLDDRTRRLQVFERKERLFRETIELKPAIESLLDVLNTFEKEDSILSSTSMQSLQTVNQKKNMNVVHKTDTV
ncbi:unnamed protein product [Rotaria socialis]|uniref:Uncharacterized protein n=1 Tax=Rotaria socialis TaxID=392032 RepID=A0A820MYV3_9BILA|nr:unnamed protein product [Rotaria socialis]CAF3428496.1 unnamed protein product [Rotaria socialis]CAF3451869.1 unnamed protein product [Rotaria socialis]CAF3477984.1 unnamed protein product [Rotaria socialis]CAF3712099.1 unnamed protein product [Rotaria socialis]